MRQLFVELSCHEAGTAAIGQSGISTDHQALCPEVQGTDLIARQAVSCCEGREPLSVEAYESVRKGRQPQRISIGNDSLHPGSGGSLKAVVAVEETPVEAIQTSIQADPQFPVMVEMQTENTAGRQTVTRAIVCERLAVETTESIRGSNPETAVYGQCQSGDLALR